MKLPYYKLDDAGEPVACEDMLEWAVWFAASDDARIVAKTPVASGTIVSTVFLGIDHGFRDGPPVLWETMMFGGDYDLACDRYRSRQDALVGHELWVLVAEGKITPIDARQLRSGFPTADDGSAKVKKKDRA